MQKIKAVFKECNFPLYMTNNNELMNFLGFKLSLIAVGLNKSNSANRNVCAASAIVSWPDNKPNPVASYGT